MNHSDLFINYRFLYIGKAFFSHSYSNLNGVLKKIDFELNLFIESNYFCSQRKHSQLKKRRSFFQIKYTVYLFYSMYLISFISLENINLGNICSHRICYIKNIESDKIIGTSRGKIRAQKNGTQKT
jgi:hypothetical protein